ncbi:hypothetical protein RhiirB3_459038 [Rhizophagus irregularis]|nr:hypothetical protein RhiirB3_459038 [Rhizophagus irregularis]
MKESKKLRHIHPCGFDYKKQERKAQDYVNIIKEKAEKNHVNLEYDEGDRYGKYCGLNHNHDGEG